MNYIDSIDDAINFILEQIQNAKKYKANLIIIDDETQPYFFDQLFYLYDGKPLAPTDKFNDFKKVLEHKGYKVTFESRSYTFNNQTQTVQVYPARLYINLF